MNKDDIAAIRRQFKLDNERLKIGEIYNVYVRQDGSEIYHEELQPFPLLEREQQELFLTNFKKVLGGRLGVKLFEVKFKPQESTKQDHTQQVLYSALHTEDVDEWKEGMQWLAQKMVQDTHYERDLVITFIRGNYFKPTKRNSAESEINAQDEVYTNPFILCSMNQTEQPKRSLIFDFIEREFKSSFISDPVINLTAPVGGFLFPSITDYAADVNHILYAAGKANQPDYNFIEEVLDGQEITTAEEDKAIFEEIVKKVVGDEVNSKTLANVYGEVHRMMTNDEDEETKQDSIPMIDKEEVERVLKVSGVEGVTSDKVEVAFQTVIDDDKYEMKANHIVPNYSAKSIKIKTKVANISVSPQDLQYVKQVNYQGKRCLLIEVEEDTIIEGFKLVSEDMLE